MDEITRREMVALTGAAMLLPGQAIAQSMEGKFSWKALTARAQALSRAPYRAVAHFPGADKVDYDALHKAQFKADRTLWNDIAGDVGIRLWPVHGAAQEPVDIHIVENGQSRRIDYDPAMFDMTPDNPVAQLGANAGFSGFRVMNAVRDADWLVFMGASYFRAAGAEKQYGLSARAITIDTGVGDEQFPRFTAFWLERTGAHALTVYALLDGQSIAGAYRFDCSLDGRGVHQDVQAALFPRTAIRELGLMPMTSMFWYDQAHHQLATDWRPEIHDSDGLLIRREDGSAKLRPLVNPKAATVSPFAERNPNGFGLIQRDRDFDHYQDDGVFYHRRPCLWATPSKPLGDGAVRLYEFPTDSEYTDNVACYWTPAKVPPVGHRLDVAYRLDWESAPPPPPTTLGFVENLWRGRGEGGPNSVKLVVDFAGLTDTAGLSATATVTDGTLVKSAAYPVLGRSGVWRTVVDVIPADGRPAGVQLALMRGEAMVTELLNYPLAL